MFKRIWHLLGFNINIDPNRVYGLDMLRAFAIISVVITHATTYTPAGINKIVEAVYIDGVSIFFVLSGFLIGLILLKTMSEGNLNFYTLINFWWRRWLRTIPAYYIILSAVIISYNYNKPPGPTFKRYYFFAQNLFTTHPGFFIETWSLSVEEWFYLLIPLLFYSFIKYFNIKISTSVLIISILVIAFSTFLRIERYFDNLPITPFKRDFIIKLQVLTRLDNIMYGVLAAYISYYHGAIWVKNKGTKLITGICILLLNKLLTQLPQTYFLSFYTTVLTFTFNAIGTALLLPYLSNYKTSTGTFYKIITYVSVISYSMYLINLTPMQDYIIPYINKNMLGFVINGGILKHIDLAIMFILTITLSIYSFKFIESPFIKLRNKVTFGKNKTVPAI